MAPIRILLVDDDEAQNIIMRSLLEREGFDLTVACNVGQALKLISTERYDVLLSDLHLPGASDGLTVISAMRHINPNAVAVLLTGFPRDGCCSPGYLATSRRDHDQADGPNRDDRIDQTPDCQWH